MFIFNLFRAAFSSELQFLVCLKIFLISNLLRLRDAWTAYVRRTETKEERKRTRTRTTKRYTLVEEVSPQILFLDTKPFVISTDELFQEDAYFQNVVFSFAQE